MSGEIKSADMDHIRAAMEVMAFISEQPKPSQGTRECPKCGGVLSWMRYHTKTEYGSGWRIAMREQ